jgi:PHD/YefM family antitoxin component YafN of YafNO toxin-antitoxin module
VKQGTVPRSIFRAKWNEEPSPVSFNTKLCYNYANKKGAHGMPIIMPIKDLRNTTEISEIAHKEREPIFITKNGYSDLVVMSSELYDSFARENRLDQAIFEAEKDFAETGESMDARDVFEELEKKYFG